MTFPLSYSSYSAQPLDERFDWFERLEWKDFAQPAQERNIRRFLQEVFDSEENNHLRLIALEWFSELALGNIIPSHAAMTFLMDVAAEEQYIQSAKLRYLFLLFGDDANVNSTLDSYLDNPDADVASEAFYRKGLIHLLYRTSQANQVVFLNELGMASELFSQAIDMAENRVDALFFLLATRCIKELLAYQSELYTDTFHQLTELLWQRQLWMEQPVSDLLEWNIYHSLKNIKSLAEHVDKQKEEWDDYQAEFAVLAKYFNDAVVIDGLSDRLKKTHQHFTSSVSERIIDHYYAINLSGCQKKIESVAAKTRTTNPILSSFLLELGVRLNAQQKKKNDEVDTSLLVKFLNSFTEATPENVINAIRQRTQAGEEETLAYANLALDYAARNRLVEKGHKTGSRPGQKVLEYIADEIIKAKLGYDKHALEIFLACLSDIISYAHRTDTLPKHFFPHLHDPSVTDERVFQDKMYEGLINNNSKAPYYNYEPIDRIAGGRVDLTYEEDGYIFPIEVKKDTQPVTWQAVTSNYLAQAQTYAGPQSEIGILVIFDISEKIGNAPKNPFRDRFELLHMPPLSPSISKHPSYVVAVIIYGNNVPPSALSTYSGLKKKKKKPGSGN
ncbi:MAG TPA: hypothetical protein VFO93_11910 [Hymenobacter sp.]|uniref:hypothetical protein n=1 Tax=Hymenobacter sp. TaxID=1898978 RepID=UPI002D810067|nr:hypothetical protein [Hymenobacter sp.]HET9504239.1 hypothetical protein [Hymenobacter sp.]